MNDFKVHFLKVLPEYYEALASHRKTFEVRKNDRDYKVGDILVLREWNGIYTGRHITTGISYILDNPKFCKPGYIVMSLDFSVCETEAEKHDTMQSL